MRNVIDTKLWDIEKQKAGLEIQRIVLLIAKALVEKMSLPEDMAIRAVHGIENDANKFIERFQGEKIPFDLRSYLRRIEEIKSQYELCA